MRLSISTALVLTVAFGPASRAVARDRLGVLIATGADQRLGDNLTEVAIAEAAEVAGDELVGARELRAQVVRIGKIADLATCAEDLGCLVEIGRAGGMARVLVGTVHGAPAGSRLRLALVDATTGTETKELVQEIASEPLALIAAVQSGVRRLLGAAQPTTPSLPVAPVAPAAAPPASALEAHASATAPGGSSGAGRGRARSAVAYGAGGLALASFATAIVTGVIAIGDPDGVTRVQAQQDLDRRREYARVSNGCWIAGGVLSIISAAAFVWRW